MLIIWSFELSELCRPGVQCWRPPVTGRQVTVFVLRSLSVSGELNHDRSLLVLDSDKCVWLCAVTTPFHSPILHELDRQSQPSRRGCHSLELQDQLFTFASRFGTVSIFSTGNRFFSTHSIGFLLRATVPEWKSALKIPGYYFSLESQDSVCCKWAAMHCNRWRRSSTLGWYLRVTEGGARRLMQGLVKLMQSCVSFTALWSHNGSFRIPQGSQLLNRSFFLSLSMVMNLGYRKNIISGTSGKNGIFASPRCDCETSRRSAQLWNSQRPECQLRDRSYVGLAMCPECPTKDWRDRGWLNQRESGPEVFQSLGGVTRPTFPTLLSLVFVWSQQHHRKLLLTMRYSKPS